jgi:hypothetical protein
MRWLIVSPSPGPYAEALQILEHGTRLPADVGLPAGATPDEVFEAARRNQLEVFTDDADLANAPFAPATEINFAGRTLVFIQAAGEGADAAGAVERLFERYKRLSHGRLYTVTGSRVKVRQLPKGTT